jgi:hypothetical protein
VIGWGIKAMIAVVLLLVAWQVYVEIAYPCTRYEERWGTVPMTTTVIGFDGKLGVGTVWVPGWERVCVQREGDEE